MAVLFQDPQQLPQHILLMAASLLGCGIDPEKSILFLQSEVSKQLCFVHKIDCEETE